VGGAGLGVAWSGAGGAIDSEGVYGISDGPQRSRAAWLPVAMLGGRFIGRGATFDLLLHHQRILDSGLSERARPSSLTSLRLAFKY